MPSIRRPQYGGGKSLLLCHVKRTTCEGDTQVERMPDGLTLADRVAVVQGHTVPETPAV